MMVLFNEGLSLPAHMALITKQRSRLFDLTVWLRRHT